MNTAKTVRKFCEKTMTSYKKTLKEVRSMSSDERGERLKAMREFIANKNIGLSNEIEENKQLIESNRVRGMLITR